MSPGNPAMRGGAVGRGASSRASPTGFVFAPQGKRGGTSVEKERMVTLTLPPEPASVANARAYVTDALDTVGRLVEFFPTPGAVFNAQGQFLRQR